MSKSDTLHANFTCRLCGCEIEFSFSMIFHRSTIVHSNSIPPKEQSNIASFKDRQTAEDAYNKNSRDTDRIPMNVGRNMQAPQRIPLGTPSPRLWSYDGCSFSLSFMSMFFSTDFVSVQPNLEKLLGQLYHTRMETSRMPMTQER